ncbi:toll/interleukin-1 receptor domain-containing protein [Actinophytocola sp.]|uniref:toll/interleukin-1 receptor domain-containing protein n=1 Tax=Actinophytocola sp. TaxID=1872138 RepID=UPI002ED5F262
MNNYEFDVFLSYSRKGSSPAWVHNHFLPKLRACLTDEIGHEPTVFVDQEMESGTVWPSRLEQVLTRSKILVSIYSAQYFQSKWCQAEWESMAERERLLGLASPELTQGLILPVLYSDSQNFPEYGLDRMWHDMKGLDVPELMFQQSLDWLEFHRRMRVIAADVEQLLNGAPPWQPDWPVRRPDVPIPPTTKFPRW